MVPWETASFIFVLFLYNYAQYKFIKTQILVISLCYSFETLKLKQKPVILRDVCVGRVIPTFQVKPQKGKCILA